jgi:hypothetical protein
VGDRGVARRLAGRDEIVNEIEGLGAALHYIGTPNVTLMTALHENELSAERTGPSRIWQRAGNNGPAGFEGRLAHAPRLAVSRAGANVPMATR